MAVAARRAEDVATSPPACYLFDRRLDEPRPEPLRLYRLGEADVEAIHALHLLAIDQGVPGAVRPDSREHFAHVVEGGGQIIGLKNEQGALIAYAVLTFRPDALPDYAASLSLPQSEWDGMACLDGVAVHPAWRGNGVHALLVGWRIEAAQAAGKHHVCATAAPSNYTSWDTLIGAGLRVVDLGRFYGGMLRYVLYRDLARPVAQPDPASSVAVSIGAIDRQREMLRRGLIGWRRWRADERVFLVIGAVPGRR